MNTQVDCTNSNQHQFLTNHGFSFKYLAKTLEDTIDFESNCCRNQHRLNSN